MPMKPVPIACARCRQPLVGQDRRADHRIRFDEHSYELCGECWAALGAWMDSASRIRATGGAAA